MAPEWAVTPLAVLATMATVIASQALISGAFSLTAQAVQLDYLPRLDIRHTSEGHIGQIYVPLVNWLLMFGCVGLVLGFRTSGNLAAAYGIAVTTTMAITTMLFYRVLIDRWFWSRARALAVTVPLLLIDSAFLAANVPKIPHGGWFPLVVGFGLVVQMTTWRRGRAIVAQIIRRGQRPLGEFIEEVRAVGLARVPGTAIYMFKNPGSAPPAMVSNLTHNHVLHETTVVLSIATSEAPRVAIEDRAAVQEVTEGVYQVVLTFGFAEEPDVLEELRRVELEPGRPLKPDDATFFIGRETVTSTPAKTMSRWREELFVLLNRGAASASRFYRLPSRQVFEVGTQVDI
jgi:KUP system potassium uptake protein